MWAIWKTDYYQYYYFHGYYYYYYITITIIIIIIIIVVVIIIIIIRKWFVGTNCLAISYDNITKFLESDFEIFEFFYVDILE